MNDEFRAWRRLRWLGDYEDYLDGLGFKARTVALMILLSA